MAASWARPIDPADRLTWAPGDAAQFDPRFRPRKIPLEDRSTHLLPVLVTTAAHSRLHDRTVDPNPQDRGLLPVS